MNSENFLHNWTNNNDLIEEFLQVVATHDLNTNGYITSDRLKKFVQHASIGFYWVCKREAIDTPPIFFTLIQDAPMLLSFNDEIEKSQISIGVKFLETVCEVWAHPGHYLTQSKTHPIKMTGEMAVECLAVEEAYHWAQLTKYKHLYNEYTNGTDNLGNLYNNHPIERDAELLAVRPYLSESYYQLIRVFDR